MSQHVFHVPVVPPDLREPETLHQIFDALQYLEHVVDSVFAKVGSDVRSQKRRVKRMAKRVGVARNKVRHLSNSKEATRVHSPAHYPGRKDYERARMLHDPFRPMLLRRRRHMMGAMREVDYDKRLAEAVDVDLVKKHVTELKTREQIELEGLGRLPANVDSVSSLLLFNSRENPYKAYVSTDNLLGSDATVPVKPELVLPAAPETLVSGRQKTTYGETSYIYHPKPGALPPSRLPDVITGLANVATNVAFAGQASASIGPAANKAPPLPVVKEIMPDPSVRQPGLRDHYRGRIFDQPPPPPPDLVVAASSRPGGLTDTPAPPRSGGLTDTPAPARSGGLTDAPAALPPVAAAGGPPPPPPPPPAGGPPPPPPPPPAGGPPPPPPPPSAGGPPKAPPKAKADAGGGGGLTFLDQIKQSGGLAMLKNKKKDGTARRTINKQPSAAASANPVSHADALAQALSRRRAGISNNPSPAPAPSSAPPPPQLNNDSASDGGFSDSGSSLDLGW